MSILWCGGEDIDFSSGVNAFIDTTAGHFRAAYCRCALNQQSNGTVNGPLSKTLAFPGGAATSAWLSCRLWTNQAWGGALPNPKSIGFGLSGTVKGLYIGTDSVAPTKLALCKSNGVTTTQLAAEPGNSLTLQTLYRLDVEVINYGVAATVNVYLDGALAFTFNGDVSLAGMANFDSVFLTDAIGVSNHTGVSFSEIIVADEDVRGFPGLVTLAPSAQGTTDQWTGLWSDVNGIAISDASPNYTNLSAQDQQFALTALPAGVFVVKAVKIAARAAISLAPVPTKVALGFNQGGVVGVGAAKVLTTGYETYEQLDAINPVTGNPWVQADLTGIQLNLRSVA